MMAVRLVGDQGGQMGTVALCGLEGYIFIVKKPQQRQIVVRDRNALRRELEEAKKRFVSSLCHELGIMSPELDRCTSKGIQLDLLCHGVESCVRLVSKAKDFRPLRNVHASKTTTKDTKDTKRETGEEPASGPAFEAKDFRSLKNVPDRMSSFVLSLSEG